MKKLYFIIFWKIWFFLCEFTHTFKT